MTINLATMGLSLIMSISAFLVPYSVGVTTKEIIKETPTPTPIVVVSNKTLAVIESKPNENNCLKYESLITKYDWPDNVAMQICKDESGGSTHAVGDKNTEYVSCGLMQIRTLPGRPTCDELKNPETNVAFAYELWLRSGFCPWTVYKDRGSCGY